MANKQLFLPYQTHDQNPFGTTYNAPSAWGIGHADEQFHAANLLKRQILSRLQPPLSREEYDAGRYEDSGIEFSPERTRSDYDYIAERMKYEAELALEQEDWDTSDYISYYLGLFTSEFKDPINYLSLGAVGLGKFGAKIAAKGLLGRTGVYAGATALPEVIKSPLIYDEYKMLGDKAPIYSTGIHVGMAGVFGAALGNVGHMAKRIIQKKMNPRPAEAEVEDMLPRAPGEEPTTNWVDPVLNVETNIRLRPNETIDDVVNTDVSRVAKYVDEVMETTRPEHAGREVVNMLSRINDFGEFSRIVQDMPKVMEFIKKFSDAPIVARLPGDVAAALDDAAAIKKAYDAFRIAGHDIRKVAENDPNSYYAATLRTIQDEETGSIALDASADEVLEAADVLANQDVKWTNIKTGEEFDLPKDPDDIRNLVRDDQLHKEESLNTEREFIKREKEFDDEGVNDGLNGFERAKLRTITTDKRKKYEELIRCLQ